MVRSFTNPWKVTDSPGISWWNWLDHSSQPRRPMNKIAHHLPCRFVPKFWNIKIWFGVYSPQGAGYLDSATGSGAPESQSGPELLRLRCKLFCSHFVEFFVLFGHHYISCHSIFLSFILPLILLSCLIVHLRQFYTSKTGEGIPHFLCRFYLVLVLFTLRYLLSYGKWSLEITN